MSEPNSTIYILYNAKASLLGKLNYACRKITAGSEDSPCAACDLTHGGLKLDESAEWKQTKKQIGGASVKQLHKDELTPEIREFLNSQSLRWPMILGQDSKGGPLKVLIDASALQPVSHDHSAFLSLLDRRAAEEAVPIHVKDRLFLPVVPFVPNALSPNHITFIAFIVGLFTCIAATSPRFSSVAVYLWLLNRFLDNLDGVLARSRKIASELGGFLDLLSDFIVYSLIPISVAYGQYAANGSDWFTVSSFLAITILEATFHVNNFVLFYIAAVSATKQEGELTSLTMKPALIEGFESGLIFTAMFIWPEYVVIMSWAMSLGVVIGTVQRVAALIRMLSSMESVKGEKER